MEQTIKKDALEHELEIDPTELEYLNKKIRANQNLIFGIITGLIASLIGAGIWAGFTVITDYQIGWMAVGVGLLVGYTIRFFGKGIDTIFGVAGAVLSLFGCITGNLLTICILVANQQDIQLVEILSVLNFDMIVTLMKSTFQYMDLLFYGIAIYEGYSFSFRKYTQQELDSIKQYSE